MTHAWGKGGILSTPDATRSRGRLKKSAKWWQKQLYSDLREKKELPSEDRNNAK